MKIIYNYSKQTLLDIKRKFKTKDKKIYRLINY